LIEDRHGKPSFHTDVKAGGLSDPLCCGGCGHIFGAYNREGMSDQMKRYMQEKYVPSLIRRGVVPEIYDGEHDASFFLIIKSLDISIAPFDKNDRTIRAFRCSQGWQKQVMIGLADLLYRKIIRRAAP